jgi:hypothetical protein
MTKKHPRPRLKPERMSAQIKICLFFGFIFAVMMIVGFAGFFITKF